MQFIVCIHLENANICKASYDSPQVLSLARLLQVSRALMLELSESLDRFPVNVRGNSHFDSYVKKHELSPSPIERWQRAKSVVAPAMIDAPDKVFNLQRPGCDQ